MLSLCGVGVKNNTGHAGGGLFGDNTAQREGGWVDVNAVDVAQPHPRGLMRPIPYGRAVQFTSFKRDDGLHGDSAGLGRGVPTSFTVRDMGLGRGQGARTRMPIVESAKGLGFGKAAPGASFPAMYLDGTINGVPKTFGTVYIARRGIMVGTSSN